MDRAQSRFAVPPSLSTRLDGIAANRFGAWLLAWYGVPLSLLMGFAAALYYTISPEVLRPIFDDSYISLNIARNVAEHAKLSFDGEEWSTGATSPLHVLLLGLLLKLGVAPFYVSVGFGVVTHAFLTAGVYLLALAIFRTRLAALIAAIAIAFTSYAVLDAGNGMETSLFMALLAYAAAAYFWSDGPRLRLACGILIGFAVLTRPEGAFLIPAFLVYRWLEREDGEPLRDFVEDAVRLALPGLLAGGLIALFSLAVSGSIGGTGGAKLAFFQEDEAQLQFKLSVAADQIGLFIGPLIPLIVLSALVASRRAVLLLALFWVPVLVFYAVLFPGGLGHYFYRYQHPVLPFLAAFAGGGAAYILSIAWQRDLVAKVLVVLALAVVIVPMYHQYNRWRDIYTGAATETYTDLEAMALDLNTIIAPQQSLATHDIGAVQYFADYEVIDLVGLANEDVIKYHENRQLRDYIELIQPDYVLMFSDWDEFFLHLDAERHPEQYELVKSYEGSNIRRQTYMLYRMHYE